MNTNNFLKVFLLIIIFIGVLLIGAYFYFTGGKGAYKIGGTLGQSTSIQESKNRGVYQMKYESTIKPDTIELNNGVTFFLEKGFRYGEWRASDTDDLLQSDGFKYQLCIEFLRERKVFKGKYRSIGGEREFNETPDTIYSDIYTLSPPYDSIYKVGELKLFKKK